MRDGHSEEVSDANLAGSGVLRTRRRVDLMATYAVTVKDEAGNIRHSSAVDGHHRYTVAIDRIELVNDSGIPDDNPDQ